MQDDAGNVFPRPRRAGKPPLSAEERRMLIFTIMCVLGGSVNCFSPPVQFTESWCCDKMALS